MKDHEHNDSSYDSDHETVDVDAGHAVCAEKTEQPSAYNGTDDPENDVEQ